MQSYIDFANKNGVVLLEKGKCQFCGANVSDGIKDCVDLFNNKLDASLNFYNPENYIYKFLSVDAHTLQHPEIHGRWNNHLHLTRLHLILKYKINWTYKSSTILSNCLNKYKQTHLDEYLIPPRPLERGSLTITDIINHSQNEQKFKEMIKRWSVEVYTSWNKYHITVEKIAENYIDNTSS